MTRVFVMVAIVICSFCRGYSPKATRHTHMQVSNAFNRLRKPKFISAPMVDQSELAWRIFTRKNGCDMAYTQMINSKSFIRDINYRNDVIDWNDYSHISGDVMLENEARLLDSNTIVQVNGNDPDTVVQCASWFHRDVAAIDLNLGCPQNIAKRGNYGAYLLRNVELVQGILSNMVDKLDCPITAKVRILTDYEETLDLCRKLERTGIQLLTIHGRTVNSSKLFTGAADWKIIQAVKKELSIPVIANGGISCRDDALRCLEETGADGVMSAEGLLENPKLFSVEGDNGYKNDFIRFQLQTVREYLDVVKSFKYPRPFGPVVRGHLFKMLHRFLSVPIHNSYRERILRGDMLDFDQILLRLYDTMSAIEFDTDLAVEMNLISKYSWYNRHRDDKADARILSVPRRSHTRQNFSQKPIHISLNSDSKSTAMKIDQLKNRLSKKYENIVKK